jgi:pimeloyl-ACP methyl ester carboxylesterase
VLTTVNRIPYFWREAGSGPVLLLLHGGLAHSGWFQWMMPRLARSYRLIAPDLRGHGRSGHADDYTWSAYCTDLEALLDLLAPGEPYYLAGQCSGGYLGLVLWKRGVRPPAAVAGIEILPPLSPEEEAGQFTTARRSPHRFPTLERAAQSYSRALKLPPERGEVLVREVFRQNADRSWSAPADPRTLEIEPFRTYELAAQVECPTLLIRGMESRSLSRISLLLMSQELRWGEFVEILGVGHQLLVEDPDATSEVLERFFQKVASGFGHQPAQAAGSTEGASASSFVPPLTERAD